MKKIKYRVRLVNVMLESAVYKIRHMRSSIVSDDSDHSMIHVSHHKIKRLVLRIIVIKLYTSFSFRL